MKWLLIVSWLTFDGQSGRIEYQNLYDTKQSCRQAGLVVQSKMYAIENFTIKCIQAK